LLFVHSLHINIGETTIDTNTFLFKPILDICILYTLFGFIKVKYFKEESKHLYNNDLIESEKFNIMRLIQFNSGLCVVLRDVQHHQTEHLQEYYLSTPRTTHHSSNSSIATTSSSIKSNGSIGINNGYHIHRQFPLPTHSIPHYQYNRVKISSVVNIIPSSR
jgi:hypothetical protein